MHVTYSWENRSAYAYHRVTIPCGSNRRAGEPREWITRSVEEAQRDHFEPCKLCFKL